MFENINFEYIGSDLKINIGIIKMIFMFIATYYTNFKIINKKFHFDIKQIGCLSLLLISAILCGIMKYKINFLISILFMILVISIIFYRSIKENSILITIISVSINYIINFMAIIINFIIIFWLKIDNDFINVFIILISHTAILQYIFKIKRFKYGLAFLKHNIENEVADILILNISIVLITLIVVIVNSSLILGREIVSIVILGVLIMFITIQKSLQLYYKQKLLVQELNETKEELAKKTKEVEDLEAENLSFSKKSHSLVHKQKSLEYKLQQMINKTEISTEIASDMKNQLEEIAKDIYKETAIIELDKTGISEIDDMLEYMQSECIKNKIEFELKLKGNIYQMTNNLISKEDLEILLADHIKNAIIAINHTDNINRSILVKLGNINETYSLYIYDSGAEFELDTLKNLGIKPSTTHADEGGTGMGFMNTFDTLRKYQASLTIEEFNVPSKDNYTKAIIVKFDKKNEFKIKSYRQNEIERNEVIMSN